MDHNAEAAVDVRAYRTTVARNHHMRIDHIDLPMEYSETSLTPFHRGYFALVPRLKDEQVITFLTLEKAVSYAKDHYAF